MMNAKPIGSVTLNTLLKGARKNIPEIAAQVMLLKATADTWGDSGHLGSGGG